MSGLIIKCPSKSLGSQAEAALLRTNLIDFDAALRRQDDPEDRADGVTWRCPNPAPMGRNDRTRDRQAHAHAAFFGSEHRIKNTLSGTAIEAGPGVLHRDEDTFVQSIVQSFPFASNH